MGTGKFIVIVLDGFGVGAMDDVPEVRPADTGSNTCRHIFETVPGLTLPNLSGLGLANILGQAFPGLPKSGSATYGRARLAHYWADTFFGHQEIMGTEPKMPFGEPINNGEIEPIASALRAADFNVKIHSVSNGHSLLVVDDACTVADNIECDPGQAFNVTAAIDDIPFERELEIGRIVRSLAKVPRVITFGGRCVDLDDLLSAIEVHGDYVGVNAPKSGVYDRDYNCVHMGYGVDERVQVPYILGKQGVDVHLLGKVADVCANRYGESESIVDTAEVLNRTLELARQPGSRFICANVQETDLAGHAEDPVRYADRLAVADERIGDIIGAMAPEDILIVMADHGNDPTIGHPHHTRELVPIMIRCASAPTGFIGERSTLSDVGASVADYFGVPAPENGASFLPSLGIR